MDSWRKKVREDWKVFRKSSPGSPLNFLYLPSFRIVLVFRLSELFYKWKILRPFAYFLTVMNDTLHGVWISPSTRIGKGFFLGHPRGLVVNPNTLIGNYVSIIQQVTIGGPRVTICDFVSINAGAKIINDPYKNKTLSVGKNSIIAAGAIVLNDVPDNSVVVGMPGKVVKTITEKENWLNRITEKQNYI